MEQIGKFISVKWGEVSVNRGTYESKNGPMAIVLTTDGEPLATLSVNMYKPECSHDSKDLPDNCFYVKDWSENKSIADEALKSGIFRVRDDLPMASSGFVTAPAWELLV